MTATETMNKHQKMLIKNEADLAELKSRMKKIEGDLKEIKDLLLCPQRSVNHE